MRSVINRVLLTPAVAVVAAIALVGVVLAGSGAVAQTQSFSQWLAGVRGDAIAQGIDTATVDRALGGVTYQASVVERDQSQPEFVRTFGEYLGNATSQERIRRGAQALAQYGALLNRIEAIYGVPPRYLVAIWAAESNFGDYQGRDPVIQALATRAYERRDRNGFRQQLIDAIRVLEQGVPPTRLVGSWAGAMGQPQFMPSAYLAFAEDFDGNGFADIWESEADVFASIANYLSANGWRPGERWGREVSVPASFPWELSGLGNDRSLAQWAQLGVRNADGGPLPVADFDAALVLPSGHRGPAFLVYDNFDVLMSYNRAIFYALTIGHLADRFIGGSDLVASTDVHDRGLRYDEVREIQQRLNNLGFDAGPVDGIPGSQTVAAIRQFQQREGVPADGHPSVDLLNRLR